MSASRESSLNEFSSEILTTQKKLIEQVQQMHDTIKRSCIPKRVVNVNLCQEKSKERMSTSEVTTNNDDEDFLAKIDETLKVLKQKLTVQVEKEQKYTKLLNALHILQDKPLSDMLTDSLADPFNISIRKVYKKTTKQVPPANHDKCLEQISILEADLSKKNELIEQLTQKNQEHQCKEDDVDQVYAGYEMVMQQRDLKIVTLQNEISRIKKQFEKDLRKANGSVEAMHKEFINEATSLRNAQEELKSLKTSMEKLKHHNSNLLLKIEVLDKNVKELVDDKMYLVEQTQSAKLQFDKLNSRLYGLEEKESDFDKSLLQIESLKKKLLDCEKELQLKEDDVKKYQKIIEGFDQGRKNPFEGDIKENSSSTEPSFWQKELNSQLREKNSQIMKMKAELIEKEGTIELLKNLMRKH